MAVAVAVDVAVVRYTKYLYWSQQGDPRSVAILLDQGNLARAKANTRKETLSNLLEAVDSASTYLHELDRPIEDYDESERFFILEDRKIFGCYEHFWQMKALLKQCLVEIDTLVRNGAE